MAQLVAAFITSRLDCCNGVLVGLPQCTIAPLQRVQNAAARLVLGLRPSDHTTSALRQLHWLPVVFRVQYKLCILMHATANNKAPVYLRELVLQTCEMASRSGLRSSASNSYVIPRTRTRFAEQAFSVAGPSAWNALPSELRTINCPDTFKRQLKTHFFNLVFLD